MIDVMRLFGACLVSTLILGAPLIAGLRRLSYRNYAYDDAPRTHAVKTGTPTMGGVLFVMTLAVVCLWHRDVTTWSLAFLAFCCALVGLIDDLMKIRGARNRGLSGRWKFGLTIVAGCLFLLLVAYVPVNGGSTGWWWYILDLLIVVGTTHAVNLTDGLDGLAAGTSVPPLIVLAWIAWQRHAFGVAYVDIGVLACVLGFLAYNRHPARLFMGDTGALLLGGVLAGSAIITGTQFLLPLIGGIFVAEAASVIVQVFVFKGTGKRVFRMSPLHHHFELCGWPETTVTHRFWVASALLSLAGAAIEQ